MHNLANTHMQVFDNAVANKRNLESKIKKSLTYNYLNSIHKLRREALYDMCASALKQGGFLHWFLTEDTQNKKQSKLLTI